MRRRQGGAESALDGEAAGDGDEAERDQRGTVPASHALRAEGDAARRVRESQRGGEGARDEPADLGAVPRVRLAADVDGGAVDDHREGEGEEEA